MNEFRLEIKKTVSRSPFIKKEWALKTPVTAVPPQYGTIQSDRINLWQKLWPSVKAETGRKF